MELTEMITDSLYYPFNNIPSLVIYVVLGLIAAIVLVLTGVTALFTASANGGAGVLVAIIGIIITVLILLLIEGYVLDIVKYGIRRSNDAPSVDPVRQISNGIKLLVTQLVYFIIPVILSILLGIVFQHWLVVLISLVLFILFGLLASMATCRLAKTDDLGHALAIADAYDDLMTIGVMKVVLTIIAVAVISFLITSILTAIGNIISSDFAFILTSIAEVYILFFSNRAFGLLYSDA